MKKIVKKECQNEISVDRLHSGAGIIVAIPPMKGQSLGILTRRKYQNGEYYLLVLDESCMHNNSYTIPSYNFKGDRYIVSDCIKYWMDIGFEFYVFKDIVELSQWILENRKDVK